MLSAIAAWGNALATAPKALTTSGRSARNIGSRAGSDGDAGCDAVNATLGSVWSCHRAEPDAAGAVKGTSSGANAPGSGAVPANGSAPLRFTPLVLVIFP